MLGKFQIKSRLKAAGIHLTLSAVIAAVVAAVVFFVWYPIPYDTICGGFGLLVLVCSVDIVLGPLLTFVVFDATKKRAVLVRDLAVIGIVQLAALTYGAHTVYIARPVALVFEGGQRFRVVTNVEVQTDELPKALPRFRSLSMTGPVLMSTRSANDSEKYDAIMGAMSGADIGTRPSFWVPYDGHEQEIIKAAKPLDRLFKQYASSTPIIDAMIRQAGLTRETTRYLPLVSRRVTWTVLINATNGKIIGFLPLEGYF
ncbi:TfpX/TfpZ family type IV pilin accessory protein [Undibacterium sp. RuRC25W]|uniref:TfpX/TfpZ family type IV pilin accessory protein n=1 Tax=Undibacterium sp. RuRC25W TaxID=3413047 RepID=UPI003BF3FBAF